MCDDVVAKEKKRANGKSVKVGEMESKRVVKSKRISPLSIFLNTLSPKGERFETS